MRQGVILECFFGGDMEGLRYVEFQLKSLHVFLKAVHVIAVQCYILIDFICTLQMTLL